MTNAFQTGLDPNPANSMPLHPASFLVQTAAAFPSRAAFIHGAREYSFAELLDRSLRLASALAARGVTTGDVVSLVATNTPEALEAHYGVMMIGAILNPINIRLDAAGIEFILNHAEAKVVITDTEFSDVVAQALTTSEVSLVVDIVDAERPGPHRRIGDVDYEDLLREGDPAFSWPGIDDERQALFLSYTSGTTGDPKGVVSSARQVYLNALGTVALWALPRHPTYLWTLPMFHAIGWCMPYAIVIMAGTQIGLRRFEPEIVFTMIEQHRVTHLCAAPIVLNALIHTPAAQQRPFPEPVHSLTAGSAPPPSVLAGATRLGFDVTHVYGMTETGGIQTFSPPQSDWESKSDTEVARLSARQGFAAPTLQGGVIVADPRSCEPVPRDGSTIGEILMASNTVMSGYLKNPTATTEAFHGGWLHTGDLAVWHPDGAIEIKDRSKDIIISGGENISSVEVEAVLHDHPDIIEAAVVATPDDKWGETPCAYVATSNPALTADDVIEHCRQNLAHYKCPTLVVFGEIPKTSTGKIQKYLLRDKANASRRSRRV